VGCEGRQRRHRGTEENENYAGSSKGDTSIGKEKHKDEGGGRQRKTSGSLVQAEQQEEANKLCVMGRFARFRARENKCCADRTKRRVIRDKGPWDWNDVSLKQWQGDAKKSKKQRKGIER